MECFFFGSNVNVTTITFDSLTTPYRSLPTLLVISARQRVERVPVRSPLQQPPNVFRLPPPPGCHQRHVHSTPAQRGALLSTPQRCVLHPPPLGGVLHPPSQPPSTSAVVVAYPVDKQVDLDNGSYLRRANFVFVK